MMKVVIIGGMAAGPKVAARLRRLLSDAEITMVEQGDIISFGSCGMPFYLGKQVPEFDSLYATSYGVARDNDFFLTHKEVKVLSATLVTAIDRERKRVKVVELTSNNQYELEYDYLVLTTGAQAVAPAISGLDLPGVFMVHQPDDAKRLQQYLKANQVQKAVIIGAGVIGMEMADALSSRRIKVTVCEAESQVLPKLLDLEIARLVAAQMQRQKVDLQLRCQVKELLAGKDGKVVRVLTCRGEVEAEAVIVAVGVRPRVELALSAGLEIAATGAIRVDSRLATSDPSIFAAGDCANQINEISGQKVYVPLASTANKQGRVVANNIAGLNTEFKAVIGTTVLQAFDLNIGRTGLGEDEAKKLGSKVITAIVSGHDAPHYYPLHGSMTIKLIADRVSGRLLGAQVCGQGESIKRLDVLSTAMKLGADLSDIANLDLGYAPPYGEAIDVAIHAANTLENKRSGLAHALSPLELEQLKNSGSPICYLDIREPSEVKARPLAEKNVLVIPSGELRKNYRQIPDDCPVVVICGLGIRSYDAVCFLQSVGLEQAVFLEGGLAAWV